MSKNKTDWPEVLFIIKDNWYKKYFFLSKIEKTSFAIYISDEGSYLRRAFIGNISPININKTIEFDNEKDVVLALKAKFEREAASCQQILNRIDKDSIL